MSAAPPRVIDLLHLGRPRINGAWVVGDVVVDPGPATCLDALLAGLGDERPAALLLTHIHMDHAGAAGALVRRWPDLRVYVHERGAPHLIDPSRLVASAGRLFGDELMRLWGEMLPVPESNLELLRGGETIRDGFEVAATPGHASHHVSYLRDGTLFAGEVTGVRIGGSIVIPPTPPPDVDLEGWRESLATIRRWAPERIAVPHFGDATDVDVQLDECEQTLEEWSRVARDGDRERFEAMVRQRILERAGPELAITYRHAVPLEHLYPGLERYWAKRSAR